MATKTKAKTKKAVKRKVAASKVKPSKAAVKRKAPKKVAKKVAKTREPKEAAEARAIVAELRELGLSPDDISASTGATSRSVYRWGEGLSAPISSMLDSLRKLLAGRKAGMSALKPAPSDAVAPIAPSVEASPAESASVAPPPDAPILEGVPTAGQSDESAAT